LNCKNKNNDSSINSSNEDTIFTELSARINKNPQSGELRYLRAQYLNDAQRYDEAIIDMRDAILLDSTQARYYHLLSDLFMDINNSSKSLLTIRTAAKLFPDSTLTQLKLSETLLILKEYPEAIQTLNELIRKQSQNAEAYFMLGLVFREMGEEAKSINALQTATELDPNLVDAWILLGNIWEQKDAPIAKRYYRTATEVNPENVAALHSYAFYLQNHDNIEEALELYKKINMVAPKYPDAYLNAGILHLERQKPELALEQFNILTKVAQTDARGFFFKGLTHYQMNQMADAKREVQNALNFDPDYPQAIELMKELSGK
ncbi:MAG TPA: tetratricopeptide repeat protein, partial [Saprospiraceae bacterium]|nr:tetratricopeptide repeat protein [Saprospiraceae bacterium]